MNSSLVRIFLVLTFISISVPAQAAKSSIWSRFQEWASNLTRGQLHPYFADQVVAEMMPVTQKEFESCTWCLEYVGVVYYIDPDILPRGHRNHTINYVRSNSRGKISKYDVNQHNSLLENYLKNIQNVIGRLVLEQTPSTPGSEDQQTRN